MTSSVWNIISIPSPEPVSISPMTASQICRWRQAVIVTLVIIVTHAHVQNQVLQCHARQSATVNDRAATACTKCSGLTHPSTWTMLPYISRVSWTPLVINPCTGPLQTPFTDVHCTTYTSYISDMTVTTSTCWSAAQRAGLHSSSMTEWQITLNFSLSTKFGERVFSFAGPHAWNQLLHQLQLQSCIF